MRDLKIAQMLSEDILIYNIAVLSVREPLGYSRVYRTRNRDCNVLFLYNEGERLYTLSDGRTFTLRPGEILYVPQYSEYSFRITDTGDAPCDSAIAINFLLMDAEGEPIRLGNAPRVLVKDKLEHYLTLFHRIEKQSLERGKSEMLLKALVYELFYEMLSEYHLTEAMAKPWSIILPAINLTESDPVQDIPIPELARLCGVSETRFRRLWGEYSGGVSPVEYRNRLRIDYAQKLIATGKVTVETAAYQAGFRDLAYFYRVYRRLKGKKPLR